MQKGKQHGRLLLEISFKLANKINALVNSSKKQEICWLF